MTDDLTTSNPIPPTPRQVSGRWWSRSPLVLLLSLAFLLGCFPLGNYDIWWHLRTGELIGERGVPRTDWYSFASEGNTWIDVHWGFQLVVALVHEHYGVDGLVLFKAAIGVLTVLFALTAYRRNWPVTVQVVVWLPAVLLMSSRLYVRPESFTLLFTAVFLWVLFHAERRPWLLWLLPLVQIVWANFQGLFIFGPILLGMYVFEAALRVSQVRGLFRHLMPVTLLTPIACCVSPYLLGNVLFVLELWTRIDPQDAGGQVFRDNVAELIDLTSFWNRGGYDNPYVWLLISLLVLSALSIACAFPTIVKERRMFRVLPLVAFGWLSWQATRNGNHFALVAGTVICWNFGSAFENRRPRWWVSTLNGLAIAGVGWLVVSGLWYEKTGGIRRTGLGSLPGRYSAAAMKLAGGNGMPRRAAVFHMGHAASYIYANGPGKQVLFDGRLEVHTEAEFRRYLALQDQMAQSGNWDWDGTLQSLGIPLIMADSEHNHALLAAAWAHPLWDCVYYDEVVGVFVRQTFSLSEGVGRVDLRDRLFADPTSLFNGPPAAPRPPPQWWGFPPAKTFADSSDFLAERSYNVALALNTQPSADPVLLRSLCWYAAYNAQHAVQRRPWAAETHRHIGAQLLLLHELHCQGPVTLSEQGGPHDVLLYAAVGSLRAALQCDPDDYSANFYLQSTLASINDLVQSERYLQHLTALPANNAARIRMLQIVRELIPTRREQIETARRELAPTPTGFESVRQYVHAGLITEALDEAASLDVSALPAADAEDLGRWYLATGRFERAEKLFGTAAQIGPGRITLRLGQCAFAQGRYTEARKRLQEALDSSDAAYDAAYGLALMGLLAGDKPMTQGYVAQLGRLGNSPDQAKAIRLIGEMVNDDS